MRIVDNIAALRVHTNLTRTNRFIDGATMRLSSGKRINSVGDDPANFAIALHMRNQVQGMQMADRNTLDGTSLLQTADASLQDIHNMMHRIRELMVQGANDTYSPMDREIIQGEIDQLLEEINATTRKVEFNNITLLNGEARNLRVQVGGRRGMSINLTIPPFRTWDLGLTHLDWHNNAPDDILRVNVRGLDIPVQPAVPAYDDDGNPILDLDGNQVYINHTTPESAHHGAQISLQLMDAAMNDVSLKRAEIGAFINRLEYTSTSLRSATEATTRSLSRVFDADMAYEMMMLSKHQILSQAGMSIMAQVNARPQQILQLLG
ncbi:MAG: flagellin [Defluviitaleaceae bacterium]|nr:flagellin [Defluviitaleaceae bacterium]